MTFGKVVLYASCSITAVCSVSLAYQANTFVVINRKRLSVEEAVQKTETQIRDAEDREIKALSSQIKAESDRMNSQAQEIKLFKLELDEFRRDRRGMMRLVEAMHPELKK